jgi:hypothetical protein
VQNLTEETLTGQQIGLRGVGSPTTATVATEARTVAVTNATITDSFAPYETHVYVV